MLTKYQTIEVCSMIYCYTLCNYLLPWGDVNRQAPALAMFIIAKTAKRISAAFQIIANCRMLISISKLLQLQSSWITWQWYSRNRTNENSMKPIDSRLYHAIAKFYWGATLILSLYILKLEILGSRVKMQRWINRNKLFQMIKRWLMTHTIALWNGWHHTQVNKEC